MPKPALQVPTTSSVGHDSTSLPLTIFANAAPSLANRSFLLGASVTAMHWLESDRSSTYPTTTLPFGIPLCTNASFSGAGAFAVAAVNVAGVVAAVAVGAGEGALEDAPGSGL